MLFVHSRIVRSPVGRSVMLFETAKRGYGAGGQGVHPPPPPPPALGDQNAQSPNVSHVGPTYRQQVPFTPPLPPPQHTHTSGNPRSTPESPESQDFQSKGSNFTEFEQCREVRQCIATERKMMSPYAGP